MLSQLIKDHQVRQSKTKLTNAHLKTEAKQAIRKTSDRLSESLTERFTEVLQTQKDLDKRDLALLGQKATILHRHADQWIGLVNQFNSALKELGDVQHWAAVIERDMEQIADTLDQITEHPL